MPVDVLAPRNTWADKGDYDKTAQFLAKRFEENFKQSEGPVEDDVRISSYDTAPRNTPLASTFMH